MSQDRGTHGRDALFVALNDQRDIHGDRAPHWHTGPSCMRSHGSRTPVEPLFAISELVRVAP